MATNSPNSPSFGAKYRPSLTAKQIKHILYLAKTETPLSDTSISIISYLAPFLSKVENAGIIPAYTTVPSTPKKYSVAALGGIEPEAIAAQEAQVVETKELYWELCYNRYNLHPEQCTLEEIQAAQEHRYLNGLMSIEEEAVFENNEGLL